MRIVTADMVALEGAEFSHGAQGYFLASSSCPHCGETRQTTFPVWDVGQTHDAPMNCNSGHEWVARARIFS